MPFPNSAAVRNGKYTHVRAIGKGAYGRVYYAKDNLRREVAVKEAIPSKLEFAHARAKFQKEAQIQAAFRHPNIIHVYHLEEDPETHELYLISEYVNGGSLADHLEKFGPLSEREAAKVALDICAALEATSAKRIVHRDIKPSNILLVKDEHGAIVEAKLGDFGIAQDPIARETTVAPGMGYPGTPLYMPPEQANVANLLDVRADIYALGITLWEMRTNQHYKLIAKTELPTLKTDNPQTRKSTAAIIARAVRDKPEDRYQTAQEMQADLQGVLFGDVQQPYATATRPAEPTRRASSPGARKHARHGWQRRLRASLGSIPIPVRLALLVLLVGSGYAIAPYVLEPVTVTIAYSENLDEWFKDRFKAFEATGTTAYRRRIIVERVSKPSGELYEHALGRTTSFTATVWVPSSSAWLEMLKTERGNPGVALSQRPLLRTPLTIAMWKPMAEALGWPQRSIGWSDVLALINDPQGWGRFGHPEWGRFTWAHTDPKASSTALSTVVAEFYAATGKTRGLTAEDVQAPTSQQFLRQLAQGIKHYGYKTAVLEENLKQYGMSYISALPMEERRVIGFNKDRPPKPLVAIYPREGTFWHEYPFIVMQHATQHQQRAADQLYEFLVSPVSQRAAMQFGYRPWKLNIPITPPIARQYGIDPAQPRSLLETPSGEVLVAARKAWADNRKRANIVLVVDTSASMEDRQGLKIAEAKSGLHYFLTKLLPDDNVALITFDNTAKTVAPLGPLEQNRGKLEKAIDAIRPHGGKALYDALIAAKPLLQAGLDDQDRINAIVLLSDGEGVSGAKTFQDFQNEYKQGSVPIFPIAYGKDANQALLGEIARFTRTMIIEGNTEDLNKVFEQLSQYF